jgi:hypothetical protein
MGDFATPADFERSCQYSSVDQVRRRDFPRLRELAGVAALQFRNLAMAELDAYRSRLSLAEVARPGMPRFCQGLRRIRIEEVTRAPLPRASCAHA